jgi:hypothetical protein
LQTSEIRRRKHKQRTSEIYTVGDCLGDERGEVEIGGDDPGEDGAVGGDVREE